jgi:hypothetical protein
LFSYFRENFAKNLFRFSQKKLTKIFIFAKVFTKICVFAKGFAKFFGFAKVFAKIFHSECGSGSRSHLNVYPDPNTGGCYLKFSWKPSQEQNYFRENFRKNENFRETKFREKWANFRLFSLFANMKKGVFVSTLYVNKQFIVSSWVLIIQD